MVSVSHKDANCNPSCSTCNPAPGDSLGKQQRMSQGLGSLYPPGGPRIHSQLWTNPALAITTIWGWTSSWETSLSLWHSSKITECKKKKKKKRMILYKCSYFISIENLSMALKYTNLTPIRNQKISLQETFWATWNDFLCKLSLMPVSSPFECEHSLKYSPFTLYSVNFRNVQTVTCTSQWITCKHRVI